MGKPGEISPGQIFEGFVFSIFQQFHTFAIVTVIFLFVLRSSLNLIGFKDFLNPPSHWKSLVYATYEDKLTIMLTHFI